MGGLPETQGQETMIMPLSREFNQTIRERAQRDPAFRLAMLQEALTALDMGEAFEAKTLLRDFINATLGFPALGEATGHHPKSLMRMFSPKGNPNLDTLADVLKELARREGFVVRVERPAAPSRKTSRAPRERKAAACEVPRLVSLPAKRHRPTEIAVTPDAAGAIIRAVYGKDDPRCSGVDPVTLAADLNDALLYTQARMDGFASRDKTAAQIKAAAEQLAASLKDARTEGWMDTACA